MSDATGIEWAEATWNPVTGCTKVTSGCEYCYMFRLYPRLKGMGVAGYQAAPNVVTLLPERLKQPLQWRRPRRIFVNSMSDTFHSKVPDEFIAAMFDVMRQAYWHIFQILTKRPNRMRWWSDWPDNLWAGTSVEDARVRGRIDLLRQTPARTRFLSIEPLIGPMGELDLTGIHWVIVGGESGPNCRPMHAEWVREVRDQCVAQGVPFFFKQWGGRTPRSGGRLLDGREWSEYPEGGN